MATRARTSQRCVVPVCRWVKSLARRLVLEQGRGQTTNASPRPLVETHTHKRHQLGNHTHLHTFCHLLARLLSPSLSSPLFFTFVAFLSLSCFHSFLRLSLQSVVSFSLSLLSCRLLLFLLLPFGIVGAHPGIQRRLLGSELRGRRTRCLRRLAFCFQTAKQPKRQRFPGMAGGERPRGR